ncbi:OmpA family protein [Rhodobacteraceae bacterium 2376]|uniref:OmpA family protein n=1 Tax=Rhabdonatronobacter sediminivivens TaxID=2743469 RepID=A0A7Z0L008_9RHOB|nr:OmpA family protein [Rhabdonatronobacter sediminivivens]NYS24893.1 OmpA family protein [Rhabdonatronobacter sediminivivens]
MIVRTSLSLGAAALFLAGCVNPENTQSRVVPGALTGAAAGAALGAATGGHRDRVLVGATVGAIAGSVVGHSMDQQAAELRRQLGSDVNIRTTGEEIILTMPQDILFAVDSAVVRPDLQSDLRIIARNLIDNPDSQIFVVGHTDNTGSAEYNQGLSERRAGSVAAVLRNAGVPSHRVNAIGRGLTQPIADNSTAQGRAQNRRVEIIIRPTAA